MTRKDKGYNNVSSKKCKHYEREIVDVVERVRFLGKKGKKSREGRKKHWEVLVRGRCKLCGQRLALRWIEPYSAVEIKGVSLKDILRIELVERFYSSGRGEIRND